MRVLVSDTSVLVDLERGLLLDACFQLPFKFAVPDLLYEQELKSYGGDELISLGLIVEDLDSDDVMSALEYRRMVPVLSLPDSFALALAKSREWTLLTADGVLRQLAIKEAVECHGVLWMLDEIHSFGTATAKELYSGLTAISQHPRCRLPKVEIRRRLAFYTEEFLSRT